MNHTVHILELNKPISHPGPQPAPDGTEKVLEYVSTIEKNNLEPSPGQHLSGDGTETEITPGKYLFCQRILRNEEGSEQFRAVSEAIWLESLWREIEFADTRVLLRILSEDGKRVFQIFRKIKT